MSDDDGSVVYSDKYIRPSLFPNMPPFIKQLPSPTFSDSKNSIAPKSKLTNSDLLVELRESLWRIPMALVEMVRLKEEEKKKRDQPKFQTNVSIPGVFVREKNGRSGRRSMTRSRCSMIAGDLNLPDNAVQIDLPIYFKQNANDPKVFCNDHEGQKIAPFPTCMQLARKDNLWLYYKKMRDKFGSEDCNFLADSYVLPQERDKLIRHMRKDPDLMWIIKPPGRNNGTGIRVTMREEEIPDIEESTLVQRYIPNPYLILSKKFDLRVYVLITSLDPLRIYVYDDGLVRFATEEYNLDRNNIDNTRIHVTNFGVNKESDKFIFNNDPEEAIGHKWTLSCLWRYLSENMVDSGNTDIFKICGNIEDLVIKSIMCAVDTIRKDIGLGSQKELGSDYNMYKLLGYDILLDSNMNPHLIEINGRPQALSYNLDAYVNRPMISEMFQIIGYHIPPSACSTTSKREALSQLLEIPSDKYKMLGYNGCVYTRNQSHADIVKQNQYPKAMRDRDLYIDSITQELTGCDVRVLVKTMEEFSQLKRFNRIFPTSNTHKYFKYMDTLPYLDKLLDAFLNKYDWETGLALVRSLCQKNVHF